MDHPIRVLQSRVFNNNIPDYNQPKNDYNYDALTKNHLPSSQKDFNYGYNNKNHNE